MVLGYAKSRLRFEPFRERMMEYPGLRIVFFDSLYQLVDIGRLPLEVEAGSDFTESLFVAGIDLPRGVQFLKRLCHVPARQMDVSTKAESGGQLRIDAQSMLGELLGLFQIQLL